MKRGSMVGALSGVETTLKWGSLSADLSGVETTMVPVC